jgi:hypothetical protein
VANFHQPDIVLDRRTVLQAEKDRGAALLLSASDIRARPPGEYEIRIGLEPAVPLDDVSDHLTKIFVVRNSRLDGAYATVPQISEYFLRISAVL